MCPPFTQDFGTVWASSTLYQGIGFNAANHSMALRISSSGKPAAMLFILAARAQDSWILGSFLNPFLKSSFGGSCTQWGDRRE
jgi:hypothetical protein